MDAPRASSEGQHLFDALPDTVFFVKDREGRYQLGNRAFTQEHHQTKDSLIGKTVEDLWPAEMATNINLTSRSIAELYGQT